jgi:hypothetical protein
VPCLHVFQPPSNLLISCRGDLFRSSIRRAIQAQDEAVDEFTPLTLMWREPQSPNLEVFHGFHFVTSGQKK